MKLGIRRDLPLFVSVTLLFAIAACGGDPETSTTSSQSTTTSAAGGAGGQGAGGGDGGQLFPSGGSGGGKTTTSTSTGTPTVDPGDPCQSPSPTTPTTLWAKKAGAANVQSALGVATDAQGNVVVVGGFQGSLDFGAGALNSAGLTDAYVAKLNSNGSAVWSKGYGNAAQHQYAQHVATDAQGNVLVTGHFRGTINFGGGDLADISNFFEDLFIAKLDGAGTHQWSKRYGDINNEESQAIATDPQGNVLVVGAFQKTINFGGGAIVAEDGGFNAFVVKLSTAGEQQWAKSFGDTAVEQKALGVTADKDGNVYVVGSHQGTIDFGGGPLTAEAGHQNAYITKLSPAGAHLWSRTYGTDTAAAVDVAVDADGNVFALGNYKGAINLGGTDFTAGVADNVFVAKLDKDGKHLWSHSFGEANKAEAATSLELDGNQPVLLGTFTSTIDFGGGKLTCAGISDIFLAKLDKDGCQVHANAYGDAAFQRAESLALDAGGNNVFAGSFDGSVDFGTGAITAAETDAYVAKTKP